MCNPAVLAVAASVVTAGGQLYAGAAANSQAKYEQRVANQNAELERAKVKDAVERGNIEQMRRYRQVSQAMGRLRAGQAASGLDTGFGSALDAQLATAQIGAEDVSTIAENTRREVQGYDINAANFVMEGRAARARGKAAKIGSYFAAASTLLGGASQAAGKGAPPGSGGGSNFGNITVSQRPSGGRFSSPWGS